MERTNYFLLFIASVLFTACGSSKLVKPMEKYDDPTEQPVSVLNIPITVGMKELEQTLNQQLQDTLYEDNNIKDGDNMMVRAEKKDDIRIRLDSQQIKYQLPIGLWIRYDLGFSTVEADGDIVLDFSTGFNVSEDWALETITEIENYQWIKKPKVKLGVVSLPVGFIADMVLQRSRETITKSIDDMVSENLKLRELVEDAWKKMHEPIYISEAFNSWLLVNPQEISMTNLSTERDTLTSTIVVTSKPAVKLGNKPEAKTATPLPPFRFTQEAGDDFSIFLQTEITYEEAERMAKDQMLGETFEQGGRSVTIEDIELYGQGNKLVVNTKLSGSYEGNVFMTGRPVYNKRRNAIDVKDLKFTLETRNFLLKSATWLLKSTIRKRIQENMDFLLDYNLTEIKDQFQEQLSEYQVADGINLNGNLKDLKIEDAYLSPDAMKINVGILGNIQLQIKGLLETEN